MLEYTTVKADLYLYNIFNLIYLSAFASLSMCVTTVSLTIISVCFSHEGKKLFANLVSSDIFNSMYANCCVTFDKEIFSEVFLSLNAILQFQTV